MKKQRNYIIAALTLVCLSVLSFPAVAQRRANVRVVLNGFIANHSTNEGAYDPDGWGDEVVLLTHTGIVDRFGTFTQLKWGSGFSPVMGANPPNAYRAGHADPVSGGIRTGDSFPNEWPVMRSQPLSADVPPIVLYEGELVENGSTVAIIPTIWEWDGPDGLLERSYNNSLNRASAAVGRESFAHGRGLWESAYSHLESASSVGITDVMLDFGVRGTRPVGVTAAGSRFTFTPQLLMVSYKIAQDFQRSSGSYGAGVVPIRYTDASLFGGDYTLLIQIEFEPIASKKER